MDELVTYKDINGISDNELESDLNELDRLNESEKKPSLESFFIDEKSKNVENVEKNTSLNQDLKQDNTQENTQPRQSTPRIRKTGFYGIDKKIDDGTLSLYDLYVLGKVGFDINKMFESDDDLKVQTQGKLEAKVRSLSGDKDFEDLKKYGAPMNDLNEIIVDVDRTSGVINFLSRGLSKATGGFFQGSGENQARISRESALYANFMNALSFRNGGTRAERDKVAEAVNFGALDEKGTLQKAFEAYKRVGSKFNQALTNLEAKGYDTKSIFEALKGSGLENTYLNNRLAYQYLQDSEKNNNFDRDEFERVYKYGEFFDKNKKEDD